ncbi:MAG: LPS export ABC transporter periplasmic protein LptC [Geminocystis sp.]|nr:LPS export ABC transporter periplasmic protein LptC [Geminocystis sp.]MCS7146670.1 LPS export ABC transporter periplasmic protein LptC [Geminocystis sp.]MCX8077180.1 LPS export ABC transporter periplasmic protein LptC [Geminocystis sp.]MDW8115496.1 LptA/OstA family protein [Geminocystis sp.]MDW8463039.1 LptA/OstA family protein [Geminocystis sp.]
MSIKRKYHTLLLMLVSLGWPVVGGIIPLRTEAVAQSTPKSGTAPRQALTLRADIQEANSETGVITARGNVYISYPARNIQATSAQAQYFSKERRLVLTGNVYVIQNGNTIRAETMTYLIDEGRFIATPKKQQQVESVYLIEDNTSK